MLPSTTLFMRGKSLFHCAADWIKWEDDAKSCQKYVRICTAVEGFWKFLLLACHFVSRGNTYEFSKIDLAECKRGRIRNCIPKEFIFFSDVAHVQPVFETQNSFAFYITFSLWSRFHSKESVEQGSWFSPIWKGTGATKMIIYCNQFPIHGSCCTTPKFALCNFSWFAPLISKLKTSILTLFSSEKSHPRFSLGVSFLLSSSTALHVQLITDINIKTQHSSILANEGMQSGAKWRKMRGSISVVLSKGHQLGYRVFDLSHCSTQIEVQLVWPHILNMTCATEQRVLSNRR